MGDTFVLGIIRVDDYVGQATIEKIRGLGKYRFDAVWTLPTKNPARADVLTSGELILKKGGALMITDDDRRAIKPFAKVCRYLARLERHVSVEDYQEYYQPNGARPLYQGTWISKDSVTREPVHLDKDNKRVHIKYEGGLIVPPFKSLVVKLALLGEIPNEFAN